MRGMHGRRALWFAAIYAASVAVAVALVYGLRAFAGLAFLP